MPLRPIDTQIVVTQVNRVSESSSHNNTAMLNAAVQGSIDVKKKDKKQND